MHCRVADEAEHRHRIIARLRLHDGVVDAASIDARRRAGLEPALRQRELLQLFRQTDRRRVACTAGRMVFETDMHAPVQEGTGGQHDRTRHEADADLRHHAGNTLALHDEVGRSLLEQIEIGLIFKTASYRRLVENTVRLRPRRAHGRPLARIEGSELDSGLVRGQRHGPAKCIDFLHQMPLADAADRRIARHLTQRFDVVRQQQRTRTGARGNQRGFGTGMAATDDDHVVTGRKIHVRCDAKMWRGG
jgi:hypothetical protein